jgi:hypothetical protein
MPTRLHDLTQRAIAASTALTTASIAAPAISEARYARIDHEASATRHALRACLKQDFGIDETMADQLAALL